MRAVVLGLCVALLARPARAEPLPASEASSLPRRHAEIRVAAGVRLDADRSFGGSLFDPGSRDPEREPRGRSFAALGSVTYGVTDRITWALPLPALSVRLGDPDHVEVVPRLGLISIGYTAVEGLIGTLDGGVALRAWTGPTQSLVASVTAASRFNASFLGYPSRPPADWSVAITAGYTWTIRRWISIHPAVGARWAIPSGDERVPPADREWSILFGSLLEIGYRPFPLVSVHVAPGFSIDAYASWGVSARTGALRDRYLAGVTFAF